MNFFCPNCRAKCDPQTLACAQCNAFLGEGAAWKPVTAASLVEPTSASSSAWFSLKLLLSIFLAYLWISGLFDEYQHKPLTWLVSSVFFLLTVLGLIWTPWRYIGRLSRKFLRNAFVHGGNELFGWHQIRRTWIAYWVGVSLVAFCLPNRGSYGAVKVLASKVIGPFDGVKQGVTSSFAPAYMEIFAAFSLSLAVLLSIATIFIVPASSLRVFNTRLHKFIFVLLSAFFALMAWHVLDADITVKEHSSRGARTIDSMLTLGMQSRIGTATFVAVWWGFAQMFATQCFFLCVRSPVRRLGNFKKIKPNLPLDSDADQLRTYP